MKLNRLTYLLSPRYPNAFVTQVRSFHASSTLLSLAAHVPEGSSLDIQSPIEGVVFELGQPLPQASKFY
jgi:hypothetical protein